jgi:hypothetical protein
MGATAGGWVKGSANERTFGAVSSAQSPHIRPDENGSIEDVNTPDAVMIDQAGLDALIRVLMADGYRVVGPTVRDNAIVLAELDSPDGRPRQMAPTRPRVAMHPGMRLSACGAAIWRPSESSIPCSPTAHTPSPRVPATGRVAASRYRQWISHKLSTWHDQFGSSGCVGCGRCIAWCPAGIDITAEVAAGGAPPS